MKKIFSLALGLTAMTTMSFAAVQQAQETVDCGTVKTITANPKAGYHFVEWNDHVTTNPRSVTVSENITYTATFAPNTNTPYSVKHYQQNLDGTYPSEPTATDDKTGTTATETAAEAKSYTGFTKVDFVQGTIAGDASTVVEIYYTRNSYNLSWVTDGDALSGSYTKGSTKYGATITAPNTPTKTGYTFKAWSPAVDATMPAATTTYTATWTANTNTAYTVKHYKQNLDGSYSDGPDETDNLTGTTGASITPAVKDYEGFTAPSTTTTTIAADGSTVVTYQYARKTYTITWVTDGDALSGSYTTGEVLYGAPITAPNTPTKTGFTFAGWSSDVAATMPAANTTYTATWTAKHTITVAVSPEGKGTVTGGGQYDNNAEVTLTATVGDDCYVFQKWQKNGVDLTNDQNPTITVTESATYTAVFTAKKYTITVKSEDDTMGTVSFE
ncbi:MAG: InlB B-repeat-containing protein [Paludibacteraceae bacterium]|nr:InlB B-repeat-containing protein [Paludibacteraceae bacterium]